jgi:cysteinyl-tRNA synthetase
MIRLIERLLKKGLAYRAPEGVYFSIRKFKPYGKLSKVKARTLKAGARVSTDEYSKNDVQDFALWKFKRPGEPSWKAPFGEGRPGWHIECSAMSMRYLGESFDIHAGGIDLLFPHHEDEIAQSEGATGKPFVRYFVEGEHLMVDGKKMSKSLGNVFTLRDLEAKGYAPFDFRYFVLGAHYRTPLNFTWKALDAARAARVKLVDAVDGLRQHHGSCSLREENELLKVVAHLEKQFSDSLEDDLNTPKALAALVELFHYANAIRQRSCLSARGAKVLLATAKEFDRVLGLQLLATKRAPISGEIMKLTHEREAHRKARRFAEADRVRDEIKKRGFIVEDTPSGPRVKRGW